MSTVGRGGYINNFTSRWRCSPFILLGLASDEVQDLAENQSEHDLCFQAPCALSYTRRADEQIKPLTNRLFRATGEIDRAHTQHGRYTWRSCFGLVNRRVLDLRRFSYPLCPRRRRIFTSLPSLPTQLTNTTFLPTTRSYPFSN